MQTRSWNSLAPAATGESSGFPPPIHASKSAGSIATIEPIIPECFVPQYSAQNRW